MTLAVRAGYQSTNGAGLTVAATQPTTIVDGDILLAFVAKNTITAPSTVPAGWALINVSPFINNLNGTGAQLAANLGTGWAGVYWKLAAGEAGTYTWGSTSATWNVQILALSGFRSIKPGAVVVPSTAFIDAQLNARSGTTLQPTYTPAQVMWPDGALLISQFVQTNPGTTYVFSALPGTMTQVANSNQVGVSQLVAFEYLDLTANPYWGRRVITTGTASGITGGWALIVADPTAITGLKINKRNTLRPRTP